MHPIKAAPIENITSQSLAVLISGKFRYGFLNKDARKMDNYILKTEGDYVFWTPDQLHETEAFEDSKILTIRWYKS